MLFSGVVVVVAKGDVFTTGVVFFSSMVTGLDTCFVVLEFVVNSDDDEDDNDAEIFGRSLALSIVVVLWECSSFFL